MSELPRVPEEILSDVVVASELSQVQPDKLNIVRHRAIPPHALEVALERAPTARIAVVVDANVASAFVDAERTLEDKDIALLAIAGATDMSDERLARHVAEQLYRAAAVPVAPEAAGNGRDQLTRRALEFADGSRRDEPSQETLARYRALAFGYKA